MFILRLELATIDRMRAVPEWYVNWILASTLSIYGSLFENDASALESVNEGFAEFLSCVLCKGPLKITGENALGVFMTENVDCPKCGAEQNFPLFWLMAKASESTSRATGGA
jgi:hypothetical protein